MYLFLAVLGLCYSMGFSLAVGNGDYSLITVCGLLIVVAPPIAEHSFRVPDFSSCGTWLSSYSSWALEHRLNSCGARA